MSEKKLRNLVAADVMRSDNQLHNAYVKFCDGKKQTKRQARKFLQKYPQFREVMVEIKSQKELSQ